MPTFNYECPKCHHKGEYLVPKHDSKIYYPKCDKEGKEIQLEKKPTGFFIAGSSSRTEADSTNPFGGLGKKLFEAESEFQDEFVTTKVKTTVYEVPMIPGILRPGNN